MNDLSLFLLDIAQNAIAVKATAIEIRLEERLTEGMLLFQVADNGPGMSEKQRLSATDPFYTTRTTRKVGLGLPFLQAAAIQTGGAFELESNLGIGTTVKATFVLDSIDLLPYGDIAASVFCIAIHPDTVDFAFFMNVKGRVFEFRLAEVREALAPLPLHDPLAQQILRNYLSDNIPLFL